MKKTKSHVLQQHPGSGVLTAKGRVDGRSSGINDADHFSPLQVVIRRVSCHVDGYLSGIGGHAILGWQQLMDEIRREDIVSCSNSPGDRGVCDGLSQSGEV